MQETAREIMNGYCLIVMDMEQSGPPLIIKIDKTQHDKILFAQNGASIFSTHDNKLCEIRTPKGVI